MYTIIVRTGGFLYRLTGKYESIQFAYEAMTIAGLSDDTIVIELDGKKYSPSEAFSGLRAVMPCFKQIVERQSTE